MGGALCRPLRRHRCRDQSRKPWRERPRCARWKWPRACPEGSLTPWLSVSGVGRPRVAPPCPRKRRESVPHMCARESEPDSSGRSGPVRAGNPGPRSRTRSARDDAADPAPAVASRSLHAFGHARVSTIWTTSDAPAITQSMLDLCSAPCKARRFAPPAHARGLRALTVPARRSRLGHYVMAGSVMTLSWTDLDR